MNTTFSYNSFYLVLQSTLESGTGEVRKKWALTIISQNIPITSLASLLSSDPKTARHFRILVSEVGIQQPEFLLKQLSEFFAVMEEKYPEHLFAFASWWHYCGVPVENEAKAIDYLFKWFLAGETPVYIKTRALWVMVDLSKKYPELKQELKICLEDQMDKYSKEFQKRAKKILAELK